MGTLEKVYLWQEAGADSERAREQDWEPKQETEQERDRRMQQQPQGFVGPARLLSESKTQKKARAHARTHIYAHLTWLF